MKLLLTIVCFLSLVHGIARADERTAAQAIPEDTGSLEECVIEETDSGEDFIDVSTQTVTLADRYYIRKTIKQAELSYRDALMYYEQGSTSKASESFRDALDQLRSAPIDASTQYTIKAAYEALFKELNKAYASTGAVESKRIGDYRIPMDAENEAVKKYLALFTSGNPKKLIGKALERSTRYRPMIIRILKEYDLPEELVYLPVVESLYNNNDLSRAGALGLWQLMPERARALGLKVNHWIDERKDTEKATRAAARYLKQLYTMFDDWHLALAAYNRGEYGLARDLNFSLATNITEMRDRSAVPKETENFVPQFIACTLIGENYKDYGFDLVFEETLTYDSASIDKIIDLEVIAKCAGTDVAAIRQLNPSLKAWCTPYNYPGFVLHIPTGTKNTFLANLAQVKDLNPSSGFIKYKVVKGDFLEKIAKKFQTSVRAIKEDNKTQSLKILRIGQTLMIRPGRKYADAKKRR